MPKFDQIVTKIKKYNQARGWDPVAEDYAKSIMIEAADIFIYLVEMFQGKHNEEEYLKRKKEYRLNKAKS